MPSFKYIAFDKTGRKRSGIIEAEAREHAIISLKNKGLYPTTLIRLSKQKSRLKPLFSRFKRISKEQRAELFFQLATLLDTGIPLVEALRIAANQIQEDYLKNVLLEIKDRVNEGAKFSFALETYLDIFNPIYVQMIKIAEKTGNLSEVLFKIASYEEEENTFRQKIVSALIYPSLILTLGIGVVSFLLVYVIPKMQKIFTSLHKDLPLITKVLIVSGVFLKRYFLLAAIFLTLSILGFKFAYSRCGKLRSSIEKALLRISIYRHFLITRFSTTLAFQLNAGIPLIEAIMQGAKVNKNGIFQHYMRELAQKIKDGAPIDKSFNETGLFDTMFITSIATGQKTGRLPEFIQRMAGYYEKRLELFLNRIVSLAEPVCILFLGLIVGFIVMSIMMPLFDINQLIK